MMVDHHPNPAAHKIIADSIYSAILEKKDILKEKEMVMSRIMK